PWQAWLSFVSLDDTQPACFSARGRVGWLMVRFRALVAFGVERMAQACSGLSCQASAVRQMPTCARRLGWRHVILGLSEDLHVGRRTLRFHLAHFPVPPAAAIHPLERHSQSQGKTLDAFSTSPV